MDSVRLISCVGVEHDLALLPFFLEHYLELGIAPSRMHIVLNAPREGTEEIARARSILEAHRVEPEERWIEPYTSGAMWEKRREVQRRVADATDWVVSADVDEFHEFPAPLPAFLAYCERKGVNCVQGVFIDRLASGGQLAAVSSEASIWEQFPIKADVMCTMRQTEPDGWWYGTVNVMVCRGDVFPDRGGHHPLSGKRDISYLFGRQLAKFPWITKAAFRFSVPLRVHHFKWTDTLVAGLRRRLDTPGVSSRGQSYGQRLLDYFDQENGIALDDVPIMPHDPVEYVPWRAQVNALRVGAVAVRCTHSVRYRANYLIQSIQQKVMSWMS